MSSKNKKEERKEKSIERKENIVKHYNTIRNKFLILILSSVMSFLLLPYFQIFEGTMRVGSITYNTGNTTNYIVLNFSLWLIIYIFIKIKLGGKHERSNS